MVDSLLNRALVEQFLVSISSLASDEFNNRDKNSRYNNIIKQLDHVEGNTQGKDTRKQIITIVLSMNLIRLSQFH